MFHLVSRESELEVSGKKNGKENTGSTGEQGGNSPGHLIRPPGPKVFRPRLPPVFQKQPLTQSFSNSATQGPPESHNHR